MSTRPTKQQRVQPVSASESATDSEASGSESDESTTQSVPAPAPVSAPATASSGDVFKIEHVRKSVLYRLLKNGQPITSAITWAEARSAQAAALAASGRSVPKIGKAPPIAHLPLKKAPQHPAYADAAELFAKPKRSRDEVARKLVKTKGLARLDADIAAAQAWRDKRKADLAKRAAEKAEKAEKAAKEETPADSISAPTST